MIYLSETEKMALALHAISETTIIPLLHSKTEEITYAWQAYSSVRIIVEETIQEVLLKLHEDQYGSN